MAKDEIVGRTKEVRIDVIVISRQAAEIGGCFRFQIVAEIGEQGLSPVSGRGESEAPAY